MTSKNCYYKAGLCEIVECTYCSNNTAGILHNNGSVHWTRRLLKDSETYSVSPARVDGVVYEAIEQGKREIVCKNNQPYIDMINSIVGERN